MNKGIKLRIYQNGEEKAVISRKDFEREENYMIIEGLKLGDERLYGTLKKSIHTWDCGRFYAKKDNEERAIGKDYYERLDFAVELWKAGQYSREEFLNRLKQVSNPLEEDLQAITCDGDFTIKFEGALSRTVLEGRIKNWDFLPRRIKLENVSRMIGEIEESITAEYEYSTPGGWRSVGICEIEQRQIFPAGVLYELHYARLSGEVEEVFNDIFKKAVVIETDEKTGIEIGKRETDFIKARGRIADLPRQYLPYRLTKFGNMTGEGAFDELIVEQDGDSLKWRIKTARGREIGGDGEDMPEEVFDLLEKLREERSKEVARELLKACEDAVEKLSRKGVKARR